MSFSRSFFLYLLGSLCLLGTSASLATGPEEKRFEYAPVDITGTKTGERVCSLLVGQAVASENSVLSQLKTLPSIFSVQRVLDPRSPATKAKDVHPTLRQLIWDVHHSEVRAGYSDRGTSFAGNWEWEGKDPIGTEFFLADPNGEIRSDLLGLKEIVFGVRAGDEEYRVSLHMGKKDQPDGPGLTIDRAMTFGRNPMPFDSVWLWMVDTTLNADPLLLLATDTSPQVSPNDVADSISKNVMDRILRFVPKTGSDDKEERYETSQYASWRAPVFRRIYSSHKAVTLGYLVSVDHVTVTPTPVNWDPGNSAGHAVGPSFHQSTQTVRHFLHFDVDGNRMEHWRPGAIPPGTRGLPIELAETVTSTIFTGKREAPLRDHETLGRVIDYEFSPQGYQGEKLGSTGVEGGTDWTRQPQKSKNLWRWQMGLGPWLKVGEKHVVRTAHEAPIALSRGGRFCLLLGEAPVLVDLHTAQVVRTLRSSSKITSAAFLQDQKTVAFGHANGQIELVPLDGSPSRIEKFDALANRSIDSIHPFSPTVLRIEATDSDGNRDAWRLERNGPKFSISTELPKVWADISKTATIPMDLSELSGVVGRVPVDMSLPVVRAFIEYLHQLAPPRRDLAFVQGRKHWPISPAGFFFADSRGVYQHSPRGPVTVLTGTFSPGRVWATDQLSTNEAYILEGPRLVGSAPRVFHRTESGELRQYDVPTKSGTAHALSPNGQIVAVANENKIEVSVYGEPYLNQDFHLPTDVASMQFSADGASLVVVDKTGRIARISSPDIP